MRMTRSSRADSDASASPIVSRKLDSMAASMGATAEDRVSAVLAMKPEVATVIVGSMNYGRFKKAQDQQVSDFKYDWEKEFYGPSSYNIVTQNTFFKIDRMNIFIQCLKRSSTCVASRYKNTKRIHFHERHNDRNQYNSTNSKHNQLTYISTCRSSQKT